MAGLSIWVYSLVEDNTFIVNNDFSGISVESDRFSIKTSIPYADAVAKDNQIGLIGRRLYAQFERNDDVCNCTWTTITTIASFYNVGGFTTFGITDWSHGVPLPNRTGGVRVFIHYHISVDPIDKLVAVEVVDDELIEDSISITQQLEGETKFNLETSFGNLTLDDRGKVKTLMDLYWRPETNAQRHIFGVALDIDGTPEFWGVCEIEDIMYDAIRKEYIFNVYDWMSYSLKHKAVNDSPAMIDVTVEKYLEQAMVTFDYNNLAPVVARVGSNSTQLSNDDYRHWGVNKKSVEADMKCDEFITEMQKHYGAYLYYNANKQLVFASRSYTADDLDISDLILEDTFTQASTIRDFDSMVVSAKTFGTTEGGLPLTSEQWVQVRKKRGEDRLEIIAGMSEDDVGELKNTLDLRQAFPTPVFNYLMFTPRSPSEMYGDYKELLKEAKRFQCTINTLSVALLTKIQYEGRAYSVTRIHKDYTQETSEVEMFEIIDDSLHNPSASSDTGDIDA